MGFTDEYPKLVAELVRRNGKYEAGVPRLRVADMLAVLGLYSRAMLSAIPRIATSGIVRSDFVTEDGIWTAPAGTARSPWLLATADTISPAQYLTESIGIEGAAWRRTPSKLTDEQINKAKLAGIAASKITYEPAREGALVRNDQAELVHFLRQTIADYDRALGAATLAVLLYPSSPASIELCKSFLSAIRAAGADLDVLAENPPTTWGADVRGALGAALDASEKAVVTIAEAGGSAAAWIGNAAGKVAGAATAGFFSTANLATLAVAGVVGYIAIQKVL